MTTGNYTQTSQLPDRIEYYNDRSELHRIDGPAIDWIAGHYIGRQEWKFNGLYHRIKGPAFLNGTKIIQNFYIKFSWWRHGSRHRLNAPAIINNNDKHEYWEFGNRI
jgi:hypothetical protein